MDRQEAIDLIKQQVKNDKLVKHMLAVEAIMRELATELKADVELWGLTSLLHDLDFELTENNPKEHGLIAEKILTGKVSEEILRAIKAHNFENTNVIPKSNLEKALIASDSISGLVIACALVMPSKKLKDVKVKTIKKKFKQKDFARACSRERILVCKHLSIELEKFFEISLRALQGISGELGL